MCFGVRGVFVVKYVANSAFVFRFFSFVKFLVNAIGDHIQIIL